MGRPQKSFERGGWRTKPRIDDGLEAEIARSVRGCLEVELGSRALLLSGPRVVAAEARSIQRGFDLLRSVLDRCYPTSRPTAPVIEFDSGTTEWMVALALAFGAVSADVLGGHQVDPAATEACAVFNLGIGLLDGLCDEDAATGRALLGVLSSHDLAGATEVAHRPGWLRTGTPLPLLGAPAVAFTIDVIETFFQLVHAIPVETPERRRLGRQIDAALDVERRSVTGWSGVGSRGALIEVSRQTSVLPFQIIASLVGASAADLTAGTDLGEAMWRIDDLADLWVDAQTGALNGILLATDERNEFDALKAVAGSRAIADAAAVAAARLAAGLAAADRGRDEFLSFVHRAVGLV